MGNYNVNLDDDLHEALRNLDEPIVDALNTAGRQYVDLASMDNETGLRRRLDDLDQRIEARNEQKLTIEEKIAELEAQRDVVAENLEKLKEESNSWEEDLNELLDDMQDGDMNVFSSHPLVDEIARSHDETPESVLDALQDRASERNLKMSESRFREVKAQSVVVEEGNI
ncbi:hypothetical protein [Halobacteriaceae bacterium SHR40]|uniref:hypothetical protein n=1 Tax=Halovenus amylolytica TaxID=2500550 RepID=UPI000FE32312